MYYFVMLRAIVLLLIKLKEKRKVDFLTILSMTSTFNYFRISKS